MQNSNLHPIFYSAFFAVLITSCGPGAQKPIPMDMDSTTVEEQEPLRSTSSDQFLTIHTLKPAVTKCQLAVIEAEFSKRVFTDARGTKPVGDPGFKFTAQSLRDLMDNFNCGGSDAALVIKYGSDKGEMTYGLGLTCLGSDPAGTFDMPTDIYVPNANFELKKWPLKSGQGSWDDTYGDQYTSMSPANIYLKKELDITKAPVAFDYDKDVRYFLQGLDRVRRLLDQNGKAGNPRVLTHVSIVSFAHLRDANEYHHGGCLVALDNAGRMIDDVTGGDEFYMRGLDLGSPCPYNCNRYKVETSGQPIPQCPKEIVDQK